MSIEEEEDPFGAFGDSDDDDDDDDGHMDTAFNSEASMKAKTLIDAANAKMNDNVQRSSQKPTEEADDDDAEVDEDTELPPIFKMDWPEPIYINPNIRLTSSLPVGGGRGYVATKTLRPGVLVLVEAPMMTWPEDQIGKRLGMESIRHILTIVANTGQSSILHACELFHPTKEHVDRLLLMESSPQTDEENETRSTTTAAAAAAAAAAKATDQEYRQEQNQIVNMIRQLGLKYDPSFQEQDEDMKFLEQQQQRRRKEVDQNESEDTTERNQQEQLEEIVGFATANNIRNRNGSIFTKMDVIRLLLALRYNGLESGVYRQVAMLNHDDYPNTAKLMAADGKTYSEVRTTRKIQKGDSLTISYLPRIVSHASRRQHLWDQHRFDIGPVNGLKGDHLKVELIGGSMPPSSCDDSVTTSSSKTSSIETACEELEQMLLESRTAIRSLAPTSFQPDTFDTVKAIEQSALELYESSREILKNDGHIIHHPILSLHLEACALVLDDPTLNHDPPMRLGVLARVVVSAYRLIPLQKIVRGPDHFEVGSVALDLANAISELLSRSPQTLIELNLPNLDGFSAWSKFEQHTRQEHRRIKDLYPHDAELIIDQSTQK